MHLRNDALTHASAVFESGQGDLPAPRHSPRVRPHAESPSQAAPHHPRGCRHGSRGSAAAPVAAPAAVDRRVGTGPDRVGAPAVGAAFAAAGTRARPSSRPWSPAFSGTRCCCARVSNRCGRCSSTRPKPVAWKKCLPTMATGSRQGAPLYKLHSPEQEQLLMQRSSEVAQQMANVSLQRSAQAASLAQNRRELAQLQYTYSQADADYQRQLKLASAGFASAVALDQAQRQERLAAKLLEQAREDQRVEADIRQRSLDEMARRRRGPAARPAVARAFARAPGPARAPDGAAQRLPAPGRHERTARRPARTHRRSDERRAARGRRGRVLSTAPAAGPGSDRQGRRADPGANPAPGEQRQGQGVAALARCGRDAARVASRAGHGRAAAVECGDARAAAARTAPACRLLYMSRRATSCVRRSVRLGRRAAGQVEVLGGLRAGEVVLISQPPFDAPRFALP